MKPFLICILLACLSFSVIAEDSLSSDLHILDFSHTSVTFLPDDAYPLLIWKFERRYCASFSPETSSGFVPVRAGFHKDITDLWKALKTDYNWHSGHHVALTLRSSSGNDEPVLTEFSADELKALQELAIKEGITLRLVKKSGI